MADLSLLIRGVRTVLEEISVVLRSYESLGKEPLTIGPKVEKMWEKLRWDHDAIKDFRSRIMSNTAILEAFNSSLACKTSQTMLDSITTLDERVRDLQLNKDQCGRLELLEWVSPLNFPAQQSAIFSRRQEGTGQWLFESPEFKTWTSRPGQTLLCRGIPGAGKTMLASIAIDHLQRKCHRRDITVAYIYCDYKLQHEQTPVNLIAGILKQLLHHCNPVPESVMRSHSHHITSKTRPDLKEFGDMLKDSIPNFSQTYIVVDALDELTVSGRVRQTLLAYLHSVQKAQNINLIMTSRFIPTEIQESHQDFLSLEIRASNEDVRGYVYGHMSDLTMSVQGKPKLQEIIVKSIVDVVDGMFLLAQLHVESLTDKTSPKAIKKALERLPTGSDALDTAYSQVMQRIEAQKPGFKRLAKRALSWIIYARRLLTIEELAHALAIEIGASAFDEENLDDIREIVPTCCGLVTIDPETRAVRLVHYTAQEYFKGTGSEHFPNAKEDIAASCLTYLQFDEFGTGWIWYHPKLCLEDVESTTSIYARLEKYPFLEYAACFWSHHAEDYTGNPKHGVGESVTEFLSDNYKVSSAAQVVFRMDGRLDLLLFDGRISTPISGMHLAAYFNLFKTVSHFSESGLFAADVEDQDGRTPLMFAAYKGNEATVKVLLHRPDIDVNKTEDIKSTYAPATALKWAAENAHTGTVELLLEREDIDVNKGGHDDYVHDDYGTTPLALAAQWGDNAMLEVLLKHKDIIPDYQDLAGDTALHFAARRRDGTELVQMLLEHGGVDVNKRNREGMTPLAIAAGKGYTNTEVLKLLLERQDVDVNSIDNYGRTVLQNAPLEGGRELIRSAIRERSGENEGPRT